MAYEPGPFDASHLYLQWGGTLPGGDEWSCGLRMAHTAGTASSLDPQTMIDAVATAVTNYHKHTGLFLSTLAILNHVKLNYIGEDGRYVEDQTFQKVIANQAGAGGFSNQPPNQVAIAVSLTTGFSRGPAHRGRFYLPMPTVQPQSDGRILATARDSMRDATNGFITALNAVNPNFDVAVFSRKAGAAAHRIVSGCEVGRVLDTQRRRRNKLAEAY